MLDLFNMRRIIWVIILLLIFPSPAAFSNCAGLVGKQVELWGPATWKNIGLAFDRKTCGYFLKALERDDYRGFKQLLELPYAVPIQKYSKVIVTDVRVFEKKAKVIILSGSYAFKGRAGWVPIEWIRYKPSGHKLSDY